MIINVGGRTDIVNDYTPWLLNRLDKGFAYSRHPFAKEYVYKLSLKPEDVDCLVCPLVSSKGLLRGLLDGFYISSFEGCGKSGVSLTDGLVVGAYCLRRCDGCFCLFHFFTKRYWRFRARSPTPGPNRLLSLDHSSRSGLTIILLRPSSGSFFFPEFCLS